MNRDFDVEQKLAEWKLNLCEDLDIGGLCQRNPTAHKWKTLYRSVEIRECAFWRAQDLLSQSLVLYQLTHAIGARILLRCGFETLAILIRLNQNVSQVLDESLDFHDFDNETSKLLLGSKNEQTPVQSINIVTILNHCNKRYPGIYDVYAELSESAHPNFEGLCLGYSRSNRQTLKTTYSNRWMEMYGDQHLDQMRLCMSVFEYEYDHVWTDGIEKLELWVEANAEKLEASKPPEVDQK